MNDRCVCVGRGLIRDEINCNNAVFIYIEHFPLCSLHFTETITDINMQQSNSQNNLNFIFSSPMSSFGHPPPTAFPPAQPDDPNSPVLFKHNINLVQTQISTVRSLAHEALNAM